MLMTYLHAQALVHNKELCKTIFCSTEETLEQLEVLHMHTLTRKQRH